MSNNGQALLQHDERRKVDRSHAGRERADARRLGLARPAGHAIGRAGLTPATALALQRSAGNAAVSRAIADATQVHNRIGARMLQRDGEDDLYAHLAQGAQKLADDEEEREKEEKKHPSKKIKREAKSGKGRLKLSDNVALTGQAKARFVAGVDALAQAKDGSALAAARAKTAAKAGAKGAYEIRDLKLTGKAKIEAAATIAAIAEAQARTLRNAEGDVRGVQAGAGARTEGAALIRGALAAGVELGDLKSTAELQANIGAGGMAAAELGGHISTTSAGVNLLVGAKVMSQAEAGGEITVDMGDVGANIGLRVDAQAYANAVAEGKVIISTSGVEIEGQAIVGVAAGVSATGEGGLTLYHRKFFAVDATVGAHVGYQYGAKGMFKLRGGKLKFTLGGVGTAILPAGVKAEVTPTIDVNPVMVMVKRNCYGALWRHKANETRDLVLQDPGSVQADLTAAFAKYSNTKRNALKTRAATSYVKIEKLQQFVNRRFPVWLVEGHYNGAQIDRVIAEAIKAAIDPAEGKTLDVTVKHGKIIAIKHLYHEHAIFDDKLEKTAAELEVENEEEEEDPDGGGGESGGGGGGGGESNSGEGGGSGPEVKGMASVFKGVLPGGDFYG